MSDYCTVIKSFILQSFKDLLRKVESADDGIVIEKHGAVIAARLAKAQRVTNKKRSGNEEQTIMKERDEARAKVCIPNAI